MAKWALSGERHGLVSRNKEGITSMLGSLSLPKSISLRVAQHEAHVGPTYFTGYLSIHTFGLLMGTLLLPPSPSKFRRMRKQRNDGSWTNSAMKLETDPIPDDEHRRQPVKAAIELFSYAMAWWTLLGILAIALPFTTTTVISPLTMETVAIQHKSTISRRLVRSFLHL